MRTCKQSTAYELMVFMADSADHLTGKASLTLTITASKAGAAFATVTPTVTDRGNGWYDLSLTTSHTDTLGDLALHVTGTGADPTDLVLQVRANVLGDTLPADLLTWRGTQPNTLQSGRVDGYLGAVAAGVIAAASFASGALDAVWERATSALTTAGTIGKLLVDKIDATISSRSTYAGADTSGTTTLLARIASALTITSGKVDVNDKTGFALTSAYDAAKTAAQAGDAMALTSGERTTTTATVWDAATSGLTTTGSIGKRLADDIDAAISSRSSHSAADVAGQVTSDHGSGSYVRNTEPDNAGIAAIKTKTDNLPASPAAVSDIPTLSAIGGQLTTDHGSGSYVRNTEPLDAAATRSAIGMASPNLDTQLSALATIAAADPDGVTDLLTRLTLTRAALLDNLTNLDVLISTIKLKTDLLPGVPAAAGDAMTLTSSERNAIADSHLDRVDAVESGLTVRQAHRLVAAASGAKATGMEDNAPVFRNAVADSKNRITAVTDEFGNRLSVTVDLN